MPARPSGSQTDRQPDKNTNTARQEQACLPDRHTDNQTHAHSQTTRHTCTQPNIQTNSQTVTKPDKQKVRIAGQLKSPLLFQ